jgi:hypothetical protein
VAGISRERESCARARSRFVASGSCVIYTDAKTTKDGKGALASIPTAQAKMAAQKQASCRFWRGLEAILASSPNPSYAEEVRREQRERDARLLENDVEETEQRLRAGGLTVDKRNELLDRQSHACIFIKLIRNDLIRNEVEPCATRHELYVDVRHALETLLEANHD